MALAIDTTSRSGSVALSQAGRAIALLGADSAETHSSRLISEIDLLLSKTGKRIEEVDLFAACIGPGSFTGLRIGLATVKALAHSLKKAVVGVSSLEAVARAARASRCTCAMVNALRNEVYAQLFEVGCDGLPRPLGAPIVAQPSRAVESLVEEDSVLFAGDGAIIYSHLIEEVAKGKGRQIKRLAVTAQSDGDWVIAPAAPFLAGEIAALAEQKFKLGEYSEPADLRALYVRASDAEINLERRRLKQPQATSNPQDVPAKQT